MKEGFALRNTVSYGAPDFPGQTDRIGQTFSFDGPAVQVKCLKCEDCGHSVERGSFKGSMGELERLANDQIRVEEKVM